MTSKFCDSLNCICCLGDEKHVLFRTDDRAETCTKNRMVLNSQDANRNWRAHRNCPHQDIVTMFAAPAKSSECGGMQLSRPSDTQTFDPLLSQERTPSTPEKCRPRTIPFGVGINTCLIHAEDIRWRRSWK